MKTATQWDTAEYLTDDKAICAYLSAALEDGDPDILRVALGNIARARGMTKLAVETGITRDGLYKALSPTGNPSFATVQKVMAALNLRLDVTPLA